MSGGGAGATTIGRIAAELGISKSTVSRALRGVPGVSDETIDAVRKVAAQMEYVPSGAAVGLATRRNHAVGVVVPSLNRWFYSSVVTGVDRVLAELNYDTILYDLDRNHDSSTRLFMRSLLRRRVDALIVVTTMFSEGELAEFAMVDIPTVAVGPSTPRFRTVGVDDAAIMTAATAHVIGLGHRSLGYVGGYDPESLSVASTSEREHAFMRAALDAGAVVDPSWVLAGRYRCGVARRAVQPLLDGRSRPTALVCASDEMAIGAMYAIHAAGLRVPEDISVIGIDDHEYAADFDLTTCAQDPEEQGAIAARQVVAELEGATPVESFAPAAFSLVERGSTAPPPASR